MTMTKAPKKAAAKKVAPPAPPKFGGSLTMPAADLKRIIETVAPAASTDEARPMLCQLHVEPGATTEFVATDTSWSLAVVVDWLKPTLFAASNNDGALCVLLMPVRTAETDPTKKENSK